MSCLRSVFLVYVLLKFMFCLSFVLSVVLSCGLHFFMCLLPVELYIFVLCLCPDVLRVVGSDCMCFVQSVCLS